MTMEVYTLVVLFIFVVYWLLPRIRLNRSLPPGPPNIPILGSIPFMDGIGSKGVVDKKFRKYGDIYCLFIGPVPLVLINSYKLAKELFAKDHVSLRRETWWTLNVRGNGNPLGIINTSGNVWQEQRRFAIRHLRDFGFGKKSLDTVIQEEAAFTIQRILKESKSNYGDVMMNSTFNVSIINILWQIIAGFRFDPEKEETKELMGYLNEVYINGYSILHYLPIARFFIKNDKRMEGMLRTKEFFRSQIKEHLIDHNKDSPRDFIDSYITEMKATGGNFHEEQLITICLDFFQAGGETSATTLLWTILYLALNPDVQSKCVDEINLELGDSLPTQESYSKMIYCNATLMEIQRMACVGPLTLPHVTSQDMDIEGYRIPKGTEIYGNIIAFHNNEKAFPEPEKFKPERFLSDDKVRLKKIEGFSPFGVGKRICMGESLARNQLFIFFIMILQSLEISLPRSNEIPDSNKFTMGLTKIPCPYYVNIKSRI